MTNLSILNEHPELAKNIRLEVTAADLLNYSNELIKKALETERLDVIPMKEEYLTPDQMAEALQVSKVTLWSWDKKGITKPLYIGKQKRYRRSDLEKILV